MHSGKDTKFVTTKDLDWNSPWATALNNTLHFCKSVYLLDNGGKLYKVAW